MRACALPLLTRHTCADSTDGAARHATRSIFLNDLIILINVVGFKVVYVQSYKKLRKNIWQLSIFTLHLQQIIIILSQNKYYCSKKMKEMTKNLVAFLT